jgi:pyruvate,water dikinase
MAADTGRGWHVVIRWLADVGADDRALVGGKAASLGELTRWGLRVPPGFVLGIDAFDRVSADSDLKLLIEGLLEGLDIEDVVDVSSRCARVRDVIRRAPLEPGVEVELRDAYARLSEAADRMDVPVAVRSSARGEDSAGASFAGEHDTYLWVVGPDRLIEAVRNCWASLFTDRATCYRQEMGIRQSAAAMGVVVQTMVRPRSAGVAFTLDPSNGDRSAVAIDACWGFGEAVVGGEVTPDSFLVDKVLLSITRSVISRKEHEFRLGDSGGIVRVTVDDVRSAAPSLTDDEVVAIARLAKQVERHYGCPQDIEWALDSDLPDLEALTLLQARPESVWSQCPQENDYSDAPAEYLSGIVSTLVAPDHVRANG